MPATTGVDTEIATDVNRVIVSDDEAHLAVEQFIPRRTRLLKRELRLRRLARGGLPPTILKGLNEAAGTALFELFDVDPIFFLYRFLPNC